MRRPEPPSPVDNPLSGSWCNADAVTSSAMEAVSFVTPVLERFFIATVADALSRKRPSELDQRGRQFLLEEAQHSRAHQRFNSSLLDYLGNAPPGLAIVQSLLEVAGRRLTLSGRLLLAATLEHLAAVWSKYYLLRERHWSFRSKLARELFSRHAREELAHRSVAFDLWQCEGSGDRLPRTLALLLVLVVGLSYLAVALPWIVHCKAHRRPAKTFVHLVGFVARRRNTPRIPSPVGELFLFTRRNFHPRSLIAEDLSEATS